MEDAKSKIRTFICKTFRNHDLQDNEDIFSLGYVNSMFALELVLFIEREFNITIENEDLAIDNFRTVDAMGQLLESKMAIEP
jgi:acyl carrier protein